MAMTNWAVTGGSITRDNTQTIEGSYAMQITSSGTTVTLTGTKNHGDLSSYLTDSTGVVGIWIYMPATTDVTAMVQRIGSGASDYVETSGVVIDQGGFTPLVAGWNYAVFKQSAGAKTGSPDWSAVDYVRYVITVDVGLPVIYLDYNTAGDGDVLGQNGLGPRYMDGAETTVTEA